MKKPVILCVDDERVILTSLMDQLIHFLGDEYTIEVSESGEEALEVLEELLESGVEVPLIISDQIMPGMRGDELLITIHNRYPQALKIFLTGQADANAVGNALNNANLYRYIGKPWDEADLRLTILEALYTYHQDKQLAEQQRLLEHALEQERLAKEALRQANEELEQRVKARTAELARANTQLQEDIAKRKQMEQDLRKAKETADADNRAKSAFLANMSHELRTLLNVILGFSQLMTHSPGLSPEFQENLSIIIHSGEHLLTLINQVLDLSKIEVGKMMLNETTVALHRLLDEVVDLFRLRAEKKGLQVFFDRALDVPEYIQTDEVKLRQVLINLLDNAVKFTKQGSVTIKVSSQRKERIGGKTDTANRQSSIFNLQFEVADTGPGIASDELDALFEAFTQTATGREAQEGTGLGLLISRKFVQLMGGEITVRSEVGRGATFTFDVYVSVAEPNQPPTSDSQQRVIALAPDQPRYRILVVDDKWDSRQFLVKLLSPLGFELREAESGQEAMSIGEQWEPHLILMDLRMSGMDGYEATKRIKSKIQQLKSNPQTVIIVTTASSFEEEQAIAFSAGCDDFLRKPLREVDIFEMMHKHLGVRYVYAEQPEIPETKVIDQSVLTSAALATLPDELRISLQHAVEAINLEQTNRLIAQIRQQSVPLAEALAGLVKQYRFDILQKMFEKMKA